MTDPDDALRAAVVPFGDEIGSLLEKVFGEPVAIGVEWLHGRFRVRPTSPLRLTIDGDGLATMLPEFRCTWDSARTYLAVEKSTIKLTALVDRAPIFRFEYERDAHSKPAAHIQVHGHRGALSHLLSRARHETPHSMEALHLPVGGSRFRPCLEDVLQFLIEDFGFDAKPGRRTAVAEGRERWRRYQLRAAVRDAPSDAADTLRLLGYTITDPPNGAPPDSITKLQAW